MQLLGPFRCTEIRFTVVHLSGCNQLPIVCRKARSEARRAQSEAEAMKQEAAELRERADMLLKNLRAAEDDVSTAC